MDARQSAGVCIVSFVLAPFVGRENAEAWDVR